MAEQTGEKTEEPTDRKLEESRKKGMVWKSRDLSAVMVFLAGLGILKVLWPYYQHELHQLFGFTFEKLAHPSGAERAIGPVVMKGIVSVLLLTLPIAAGAAIVGGLSEFLQSGGVFSLEAVIPKLEKVNPFQGIKNIFNKKQFVELGKATAKIFAGAYVAYGVLRDGAGSMALCARGDAHTLMAVLAELMFQIALRLGILFLVFSIFDVWWQRRVFMKEQMMTKDEVKREYKETEGDPHFKSRRKEIHQEILESIQMQSVKDADVVVTNPNHMAVALKYDREKDQAPKVVAKGMNLRAEAIKAIAKEGGVAQMRNIPLAHALFRLDVGAEIPEALYDAVAEVLNFVYALKAPLVVSGA